MSIEKHIRLEYKGDVYRPSDDTWLLIELLKNRKPKGETCVDLGSGSGIIGIYALLENMCKRMVFVDIAEDAVETTLINTFINNVHWKSLIILSNEKSIRERSIDLVFANPPYLPTYSENYRDIAVNGGVEGYETVLYFIDYASEILADNGKLYLVYSSLSKPSIILKHLEEKMFVEKQRIHRKFFFETIHAVECEKHEN
ncbi:MAG: methyltransferase [Desulfurococcaceae archaeon]